jgi:S-formylglutathione hydrolase FrmB
VVTAPSAGAVLREVSIPSSDGFRPRPAFLYLPPAAVRDPDRRLPVLELLHGTPGQPVDWIKLGGLMRTVNAFATAHDGEAPIIVMPDLNGAFRADSECIRTADGKDTETYLTTDVVHWVRSRYARAVGQERWWVAGLSEGGVCSLMLALRHPQLYSALGDFSGVASPIVEHFSQLASDRRLYRGDRQDQREHQPLWLLAHGTFVGLPAWFECGTRDRVVAAQQATIVAAAHTARLDVHAEVVPGRHGWAVWSAALQSLLPWLWSRR